MDHEETLKGLGGGGGNPYNTPSLTKCTCVVSELELDVYSPPFTLPSSCPEA